LLCGCHKKKRPLKGRNGRTKDAGGGGEVSSISSAHGAFARVGTKVMGQNEFRHDQKDFERITKKSTVNRTHQTRFG